MGNRINCPLVGASSSDDEPLVVSKVNDDQGQKELRARKETIFANKVDTGRLGGDKGFAVMHRSGRERQERTRGKRVAMPIGVSLERACHACAQLTSVKGVSSATT
jgi:hypothetical protein